MSNTTNTSSTKVTYYFVATPYAQCIAAIAVTIACTIIFRQMYCHLKFYSCPKQQKLIIRMLLLFPAYAVYSFASIIMVVHARIDGSYIECIHDIAEAFALYCFLSLCYEYLGGEGNIMCELRGKSIGFSLCYGTCCFSGRPYTIIFLRFCKVATIQYVLIKPLTSLISIVLLAYDKYTLGDFSYDSGYVYIFIVNNATVSLALYGLLLFYFATKDMLRPFSPVLKFGILKIVIILSFWQSVLFTIFEKVGVISERVGYNPGLISAGYKNFLTCLELVVGAVACWFAFPYSTYQVNNEKEPNKLSDHYQNFYTVFPDETGITSNGTAKFNAANLDCNTKEMAVIGTTCESFHENSSTGMPQTTTLSRQSAWLPVSLGANLNFSAAAVANATAASQQGRPDAESSSDWDDPLALPPNELPSLRDKARVTVSRIAAKLHPSSLSSYLNGNKRLSPSIPTMPSISANIIATIDPTDIVQDTIHNFHPMYRHYTQYSNDSNI